MMNWTATEKPVVTKAEIEDNLDLGEGRRVHITYGQYQYCSFAVYADYDWRDANLNVNDREGSRSAVLRHLLPRAEAALEALRQAVAELPPCRHNEMIERKDDPDHAWECAECGYVYGLEPIMVRPATPEEDAAWAEQRRNECTTEPGKLGMTLV